MTNRNAIIVRSLDIFNAIVTNDNANLQERDLPQGIHIMAVQNRSKECIIQRLTPNLVTRMMEMTPLV